MFNVDENHFVVYFNDCRTLTLKGDEDAKFGDVVNKCKRMKMMVMLVGGL